MPSNGYGLFLSYWSVYFAQSHLHGVSCDFREPRTIDSQVAVIEHGQPEAAEKAIARLQSTRGADEAPDPRQTVALLSRTLAFEKEVTRGAGYMDCFRGTNLRRTEIAVGTWTVQQMCGPVLQTFAIFFFEQAGLPASQAFNLGLGLVSSISAKTQISVL